MAVTRRGYVFGAFLLGVLSVLVIIVSIAGENWVTSVATEDLDRPASLIRYGLFTGLFTINTLATPNENTVYMTCVADQNSCAYSCKTTRSARQTEVRLLSEGRRPLELGCNNVTNIVSTEPLENPVGISFLFYIFLLILLFLQLAFAVMASGLAITNATMNPTEAIFGLPGCLWSNVIAGILGVLVLLMYGVYWAASDMSEHLAFPPILSGQYEIAPTLGYNFWILIAPVFCAFGNVALIELRRYLLEKDPPAPVIKVENHSTGTIYLY